MAKRKKGRTARRTLGSSASEHQERLRGDIALIVEAAADVREAARAGRCASAMEYVQAMERTAGHAEAHLLSTHLDADDRRSLQRAQDKADAAAAIFVGACVAPNRR